MEAAPGNEVAAPRPVPCQAGLSLEEKRKRNRLRKRRWREDGLGRSLERAHSTLATPQSELWEEDHRATRRRRHPARKLDHKAKKQRWQRRREAQARASWWERAALVQLRGERGGGGQTGTEKERPEQAAWAHSPAGNPASQSGRLLGAVVVVWRKGFCGVGPARGGRWVNLNMFWTPSGWSLVTFVLLLTPGVASVSPIGSGPSAPG